MKNRISDLIIAKTLYIIQENGDISELFEYGLSLIQIPALLKYIENLGYCRLIIDEYVLTAMGQELLNTFLSRFTRDQKYVKPLYSMRIPRQSAYDIYLPKISSMV